MAGTADGEFIQSPTLNSGDGGTTPRDFMLRPEARLLGYLARVSMDSATVDHVQNLIEGEVDWSKLVEAAKRHRIRPLVYRSLNQISSQAVPTAILNDLKKDFQTNAVRNLALARELSDLLRLFELQGIVALPFKGPTLAEAVYGSLSLRQSGDLDILIHRRDAVRCKDLLVARGYRLLTALSSDGSPVAGEIEYQFERTYDRLSVELRWRLNEKEYAAPLDLDRLIGSAFTTEFSGIKILALAPEDLLLLLCVHGSKHRWSCLMWICDVAELLRVNGNLDWNRMEKQASALGLWRNIVYGLLVARETLGTNIPAAAVLGIDTETQLRPLVVDARERLFMDPGPATQKVFALRMSDGRHWFTLLQAPADRLRYRFQFVSSFFPRLTPNEKDRLFLSLPAGLGFLYYILRPVRLIREYFAPFSNDKSR